MTTWREVMAGVTDDVQAHFDLLKGRLTDALGGHQPVKVLAYRGYGTPELLYFKGRVVEDKGARPGSASDSVWDNLVNMYKRVSSGGIPYARVRARFQDSEQEIEADEHGVFDMSIRPTHPLPGDVLWHHVALELTSPEPEERRGITRAVAEVLVPPASTQYIVVSDIDDTVLQTDVGNVIRMARNVFLGNAHTRLPFHGVAAFYRALHRGSTGRAVNPMLYVSSSPWSFYELLSQFFRLNRIPIGPILFLRTWVLSPDLFSSAQHRQHKLSVIRGMLDQYRELPFVLIGDSGEQDPEIYQELVDLYPGRVLATYIRHVSADRERLAGIRALAEKVAAAGSAMVIARDSLAMAVHAAEHGLIPESALPSIEADKAKDEAKPSIIETLIGEDVGAAALREARQRAAPATPEQAKAEAEGEAPKVEIKGETPAETEAAVEGHALEKALQEGASARKPPPTVVVESEETTEEIKDKVEEKGSDHGDETG